MGLWPNEDASCVPVFDGGAAEGPLSGCLHCFNNEGSRLLLFGGVWRLKPSVTASTSLESTVGL